MDLIQVVSEAKKRTISYRILRKHSDKGNFNYESYKKELATTLQQEDEKAYLDTNQNRPASDTLISWTKACKFLAPTHRKDFERYMISPLFKNRLGTLKAYGSLNYQVNRKKFLKTYSEYLDDKRYFEIYYDNAEL